MSKFHNHNGRYSATYKSRYADYIKDRIIDGKDPMAINSHDSISPLNHGSYGALILHPSWRSKRMEIIERDNNRCRICNSEVELQVHHRQYHFIKATQQFKVPWDYPENLLITLCSKCHARGHSKYKVPFITI